LLGGNKETWAKYILVPVNFGALDKMHPQLISDIRKKTPMAEDPRKRLDF
jgi:hypothetical protein